MGFKSEYAVHVCNQPNCHWVHCHLQCCTISGAFPWRLLAGLASPHLPLLQGGFLEQFCTPPRIGFLGWKLGGGGQSNNNLFAPWDESQQEPQHLA